MPQIQHYYTRKPRTNPLRAPGGKFRIRNVIVDELLKLLIDNQRIQFREVFSYSAPITFEVMRKTNISKFWINDKDPAISSYWVALRDSMELFQSYLKKNVPTRTDFDKYKSALLTLKKMPSTKEMKVHVGFMKLVTQRITPAGLGTQAGSAYKNVSERWNEENLLEEMRAQSIMMRDNDVHITNLDFEPVIRDESRTALLYLDPPYYELGHGLYQHKMNKADHIRLAMVLKECPHKFVLSYDDCPAVRELYSGWTTLKPMPMKYSSQHQGMQNELLIIRK